MLKNFFQKFDFIIFKYLFTNYQQENYHKLIEK